MAPLAQKSKTVIIAKLSGSDTATAEGVTATGASPVLALCRGLLDAGFDPVTPLHAYRGDTLALRIRSIGEAAELEVTSNGIGFIRRPARLRTGAWVRFSKRGGTGQRSRAGRASGAAP